MMGVVVLFYSNAIIPSGDTYDTWSYPFTASGKNGRLGVPEWYLQNRVEITDGTEIWQIYNNENKKLIAVYDEVLMQFIIK